MSGVTDFVSGAKRFIPGGLQPPLRAAWRAVYAQHTRWINLRLKLSYLIFRLKGGRYIDWYGDKLDSWAATKRDPASMRRRFENIADSGQEDLQILKQFGMEPHHTLHEYGAGMLRSAHQFMSYLEAGNYSGNDASGERLDTGKALFAERVAEKQPTLIVNRDNSLDWLEGRTFDFVWCHAVFGHMPAKDVEETIANIRRAMHDKSVFFFSYDPPTGKLADRQIVEEDVRNWLQSYAFYEDIAARHGYLIEDVSDVVRKYESWRERIHLARMTLKPGTHNTGSAANAGPQ